MAQGKIENRQATFQKKEANRIRPWQRRTTIAPFGIADLEIDHTEVKTGETITISFKAVNPSEFTSIYPVTLKLNDEVVASEVVSLPRRTSLPIKFTISQALPGNYMVNANNSLATFKVIGRGIENEIAKIDGIKPDVSDIEANFDFTTSESIKSEKQEELIIKSIASPQRRIISVIDNIGKGIEFGLDKLGDILIFPIAKLVDLFGAIFKHSKQ